MKIVQIIPSFNIGGAEVMCENLTYDLLKKGHDVIVLSLYNDRTAITDRLIMRGVRVLFLDKKRGFDISIL